MSNNFHAEGVKVTMCSNLSNNLEQLIFCEEPKFEGVNNKIITQLIKWRYFNIMVGKIPSSNSFSHEKQNGI